MHELEGYRLAVGGREYRLMVANSGPAEKTLVRPGVRVSDLWERFRRPECTVLGVLWVVGERSDYAVPMPRSTFALGYACVAYLSDVLDSNVAAGYSVLGGALIRYGSFDAVAMGFAYVVGATLAGGKATPGVAL